MNTPRLLLLLAAIGALPALAAIEPPGGGGTTPPPDNMVTSRFLPVRAALPGYAEGAVVALKFTIYKPSSNPLISADETLYQETLSVTVRNGWFSTSLGSNTSTGVPLAIFDGKTNVRVWWALSTVPDTSIGSQPIAISAHAHGFAPNAVSSVATALPALELANTRGAALAGTTTGGSKAAANFVQDHVNGTGAALLAESNGAGGVAVRGETTDAFGAGVGVEGRTASASGAGGLFVNTGGGDLISGVNASTQAFRVDNAGNVYQAGVKVTQFGPKGPKGPIGDQGPPGPTGPAGPTGATQSVCVVAPGNTCIGHCSGGLVIKSAAVSPCQISSQTGTCFAGDPGSICCVCGQ